MNAQRRATDVFAPPAPLPETMAAKSPERHSTGNIGSTSKPSNSRSINLRQELAHRQLLQQQQPPLMIRRSSSRASHVS
ncbi:hypothetical protein AGABI2DRAFT_190937, partial [Agaricus bisporus var. bisporus H97]|uniref:hypothetical protein n=1 Tax=Agaricus bisporus var. bisporus (strain H97 / ATCC MYA-4626 / FGSC 10389) TaxID=936046 RepID=UPI00029F6231